RSLRNWPNWRESSLDRSLRKFEEVQASGMPISHRSGPYEVPAGAGTSPQGEQLWARSRRCRASGTALRGDRRAGEAVAAVLDVTGEPLRPRAVAADRDGHVVPAARLGD